ncbi:peptidase U32 family protein [Desulfovulcanus sp.]
MLLKEQKISLPELLCPAGNFDKLKTAIFYGADAVYLGGRELNLRAKTQGFDFDELERALCFAHKKGVKVYFCLNLLAFEHHLPMVEAYLHRLALLQIDGLIIADPGIISLAQKICPHIPIHLSTQANTSNSASVKFWQSMGIKRLNLARELGFKAIRAMAAQAKDIELELFVHGAMCMAISGRCFLSAYMNDRSANQGLCTHPCRFEYRPTAYQVEEKTRPGNYLWEVVEEGDFTRFFAAEDLCLIKYLKWFQKIGIASLKIEGRMKTTSYLAQVVDVYKTALNALENKEFDLKTYLQELKNISTRPLGSGFFLPHRKIFAYPLAKNEKKIILAQVVEQTGAHKWRVKVKEKWDRNLDASSASAASAIELVCPGLKRPVLKKSDYALEKENGEQISLIHPGLSAILCTDHPLVAENIFIRLHRP